jgi:predicted hotdog family 3-hydroxylacyl-ACP dehydratase
MKAKPALPLSAELLIPHRSPVLLIDRLIQFENLSGIVESVIRDDNVFLKENGELEQCAMMELIAQSFAVVKGYSDLINGKPIGMGFLVGVKDMKFMGSARKRETLHIAIEVTGETGDFALAEGKVRYGDDVIATGNLMVWLPQERS